MMARDFDDVGREEGDDAIRAALGRTKRPDNIVPLEPWKSQIQQGRDGPKRNLSNLLIYVRNLDGLRNTFAFNEMSGTVEWNGHPIADGDYTTIRLQIERAGFTYEKADIPAVVDHVAKLHIHNPITEYLDGLKWDKRPRVNRWLHVYLGATADALMEVFGAKFLIAAVARAYRPGCKVDTMLVLEGPQGSGKTTVIGALFGDEYMTSSMPDFSSKEAAIAIQGRWVVEVAELAALQRSDVRDIKKFLSETVDRYRPVHGRNTIERPRRCVFIATTNEGSYLKDATGNRRYWPVECGRIDLLGIKRDRDQLWAEARERFLAGEKWWLTDQAHIEAAALAQADRIEEDVWAPAIDAWLAQPEQHLREWVTAADVLTGALNVRLDAHCRRDEMRVGSHLASCGWKHVKRRIDGKSRWAWERSA